jgi:putative oxygen-independent coproporphyrinogen III oxidase
VTTVEARPPTVEARPPIALYVHVPFCVSLCPYCDFVVYGGAAARGPKARTGTFVDAVMSEIELRADALDERFGTSRAPLETVYLGGGTPSLLPAADIERLLARVRDRFGIAPDAEVTLEANPGPDERGDPAAWRRAGITRISFGAQSLDDAELRRLGRRHRAADVATAVAGAREVGIASINLDLLYDTPEGTLATWTQTLAAALELAPDHLSVYALTLDDPDAEGLTGPRGDHLPTTSGARRWRERARLAQDEDLAAAQYGQATAALATAGFRGYEISNWARPGHESRHNLAYWQRRPYEAVGPGAHAFDGAVRRWNAARLDGYVAALTGPHRVLPPGGADVVDGPAATAETLILGLRLDTGVPLAMAGERPLAEAFGWARAADLLDVTADERVVLTTRGRLLSNELLARLV